MNKLTAFASVFLTFIILTMGFSIVYLAVDNGTNVGDVVSNNGGDHNTVNQTKINNLDREEVEKNFYEIYNNERESRGLGTTEPKEKYENSTQFKANDMMRDGYTAHQSPDGEVDFRDLINQFNLTCPSPLSENLAQVHYTAKYRTSEGNIEHLETERELARGLFGALMRSDPHRRAMLGEEVETVGVGVAVADNGKSYIAMHMCDN